MKLLPILAERTTGFSMIFLDPPYFDWNVEEYNIQFGRYTESFLKPDHQKLSKLAFQLLSPNGTVWLCGTIPQLLEDYKYWKRYFRVVFEIIQYKTQGTPPINRFTPMRVHENIWCMIKKNTRISETKLDITRAAKSRKPKRTRNKEFRIRRTGTIKGIREGVGYPKTVIQVPQISSRSKEYYGHPTQKPLKLMRTIIKMSTEEGDTVLDPFAGSGTTLIACEEMNRNCLGIEINKKYIQMIKKRIQILRSMEKLDKFIL